MKVIIKILGFIVLCFLLVWGVSLGKCEILTAIHGDEFSELYKSNTMLGEQEYLKVLEYSDSSARVYYVGKDNSMANIICFVKREGQWEYLATFEATKKWIMPLRNWGKVYGELSIMYDERLF